MTDNHIPQPLHPLKRISFYLPMLAGPLAICTAIVYCRIVGSGNRADVSRALQTWLVACETLAPMILTLALAVYWAKAIFTRNLTYVILGVLVGVLLLRELHWKPETEDAISIKDAVFPLLGICFVWMLLWQDIIDKPSENWLHTIFLVGAIVTYGLGQMVEKRLFRFLPDEQVIHSQIEEAIECAGHCLIFLAALLGSWARRRIIITEKPITEIPK